MSRRGRGGWYSSNDFSRSATYHGGGYENGGGYGGYDAGGYHPGGSYPGGGTHGRGRGRYDELPQYRDDGYRGRGQRGGRRGTAPASQSGRIYTEEGIGACTHFATNGSCRFGSSCRYLHCVRRVGAALQAHEEPIQALEVAPIPGTESSIQIFTGGKDGLLKRWTVTPRKGFSLAATPLSAELVDDGLIPLDAIAPPKPSSLGSGPSDSEFVHYDVEFASTSTFSSAITCIILSSECLFIGLHSGKIHGYLTSGTQGFELAGHTAPVHSILLVDNVLITGDFQGSLMFWRPQADADGSPTFSLVQQMRLENGIKCLRSVDVQGPEGVVKTLWVGCVNRVILINLQTLTISMNHPIPVRTNNQKLDVCMDVLPFNNNVLAACLSGKLLQFAQTGELLQTYDLGMDILVLSGIVGPSGPCAAIGAQMAAGNTAEVQETGYIACYDLSNTFTGGGLPKIFSLGACHKRIRCLRSIDPPEVPGMPKQTSLMVTGSEQGQLCLWTLATNPDAMRPQQRRR